MVGQRFVQLLESHPWFEVAWLAASERSSGLPYAEASRWKLNTPIPERVAKMVVSDAVPDGAPKVIFAALDAGIAKELEPKFAQAGHAVITNSSAFRMDEDVPLVIPEVNGDHLKLIDKQPSRKRNGGFIATNPNCSAIGLVMALAPLHRAFGVDAVFVATMQAVSGAGYPGVASLDILGNVIPFIPKEEEKLEAETRKLLGVLENGAVKDASFKISAQCNRVAVEDGHTESVSIKLKKAAKAEEILGRVPAGTSRATFGKAIAQMLQIESALYAREKLDEPEKLAIFQKLAQSVLTESAKVGSAKIIRLGSLERAAK